MDYMNDRDTKRNNIEKINNGSIPIINEYISKYNKTLRLMKHLSWVMVFGLVILIMISIGAKDMKSLRLSLYILGGFMLAMQGVVMWKSEKKTEEEQNLRAEREKGK